MPPVRRHYAVMPLDRSDSPSQDESEAPKEDESEPPSEENGEFEPCPSCRGSGKISGSLDNQVSRSGERQTNRKNGLRIGSLFISSKVIGKGSNGTTVLWGTFGKSEEEKRPVAVKRLVKDHHRLAYKEIELFIQSDNHPNILRYFTKKRDRNFVYLALELCDFSLDDLIQAHSASSKKPNFSVRDAMQDIELLRADRNSSPLLLKLMRDIVSGLVHLHKLGIIHRDLNPRNVLITKQPSLCAKLSDMGISKRLPPGKSSLGCPASGSGTTGWQAPEQLLRSGRQTCRMDMFNLGSLLFFCLTLGSHPFGRDRVRDLNIEKNRMNLTLVESIPEARDLISRLLSRQPELRPTASEVLCHPFFWNPERRLSFLRDLSNELNLPNCNKDLLEALQNTAPMVFSGRWTDEIETEVMACLSKFRDYEGLLIVDLLRAVRNVFSHLWEYPIKVQKIIGSGLVGLEAYFAKKFPSLLMESYKVAFQFLKDEKNFQEYLLFNPLASSPR